MRTFGPFNSIYVLEIYGATPPVANFTVSREGFYSLCPKQTVLN